MFIIGEAGINHDGSLSKAKELWMWLLMLD